jgi:hypothetical protein
MISSAYIVYALAPIFLAGVGLWAWKSDKNVASSMGRRVMSMLPDGWRLVEGGMKQNEFPFEMELPRESVAFSTQNPAFLSGGVIGDLNADTWLFGNCTERLGSRSVVGSSVMVAIKLRQIPDCSIRIQKRMGGRLYESIEDDRFQILDQLKKITIGSCVPQKIRTSLES